MGNETRKGRTTILYKFNNINMSKKDFYENNGFILVSVDESGEKHYMMNLSEYKGKSDDKYEAIMEE